MSRGNVLVRNGVAAANIQKNEKDKRNTPHLYSSTNRL
jgi:hypothetical protein